MVDGSFAQSAQAFWRLEVLVGAKRGLSQKGKISVAVITGGHNYDVPGFRDMFERMPGIDYFLQELDNWAIDDGGVWDRYDVHLFYNMHQGGIYSTRPREAQSDANEKIVRCLERLGETGQGILLLHHAILAFPEIETWSKICNIRDRSLRGYDYDIDVASRVVDHDHPITRDHESWTMIDEVYLMDDAGEGSEVLLTADQPNSMKCVGWTHEYKKSRVFCYQSGHNNYAYTDATYQSILLRGIKWVARAT